MLDVVFAAVTVVLFLASPLGLSSVLSGWGEGGFLGLDFGGGEGFLAGCGCRVRAHREGYMAANQAAWSSPLDCSCT